MSKLTFLFKVEQTFEVIGKGIVLVPGPQTNIIQTGTKIKLIRPDNSTIETTIAGIVFETNDILLKLEKKDVPVGTEVWLSS